MADVLKNNETIHIFMGWEYMTNLEKMCYTTSRNDDSDADSFCERIGNLPSLKKEGSIINTISHDDVFYSEFLTYHRSLDALMPVIEKIRNEYFEDETILNVINTLLGEYYFSFYASNSLDLSASNLFERVVLFIELKVS
jgi:hypothetical protein